MMSVAQTHLSWYKSQVSYTFKPMWTWVWLQCGRHTHVGGWWILFVLALTIQPLQFSSFLKHSGLFNTIHYETHTSVNPLTPGTFCKKCVFLEILVLFKLDLGQISFNPVKNAFATQQLAFLATSITFYHIVTRACVEIKILRCDLRL